MSTLTADDDSDVLQLAIGHVFSPAKLPQKEPSEQINQKTNVALCNCLIRAARDFLQDVPFSQHPLWKHMVKMMELARRAAEVPLEEADLQRVFSNMAIGGMSVACTSFRH